MTLSTLTKLTTAALFLTTTVLVASLSAVAITTDFEQVSAYRGTERLGLQDSVAYRASGRLDNAIAYRASGRLGEALAYRATGRLNDALAYRASGRIDTIALYRGSERGLG